MAEYLTNTTDLTTVADAIRNKGGTSAPLAFPDGFAAAIGNIPTGKTEQSKTLALGASTPQTVTPDSGKVLSSVPVTLDTSVIKAENIKKDVQILGITGTHEGGSTPTLIEKSITQNGTYNASADNADGYSRVVVNVAGGSIPELPPTSEWLSTTFTLDQDYKISSNYTISGSYVISIPAGKTLYIGDENNHPTVNILSNIHIAGTIVNYGDTSVRLQIDSPTATPSFRNYGKFTWFMLFNETLLEGSTLYNAGTFTIVNGMLLTISLGSFTNNGIFVVGDEADLSRAERLIILGEVNKEVHGVFINWSAITIISLDGVISIRGKIYNYANLELTENVYPYDGDVIENLGGYVNAPEYISYRNWTLS